MHDIARYYPIVTTIFSFIIAWEMFVHYRQRKSTYLLCWVIGVCAFGLAALAATINVLVGWFPANLKFWYIVGALVGGFPLAQGTLYFLTSRKLAGISTIFFLIVIAVGAVAVALTPVSIPPDFDYELTGKVFAWKWVRYFSPIVNSYSFLVVVGGAIYSAYRYYSDPFNEEPHLGNATISLGGILPGIGGTLMRMGYVNALFVMEFFALVVIYSGYRIIKRSDWKS
jgi:hypothetical protein